MIRLGGSFESAPSIITSVHSPWQRMESARQFASRIANSLDQKGVVMPLPIRMAQPCCSLTTLKVIMARHRKWPATKKAKVALRRIAENAARSTSNISEDRRR
jgi:hypothetical protein